MVDSLQNSKTFNILSFAELFFVQKKLVQIYFLLSVVAGLVVFAVLPSKFSLSTTVRPITAGQSAAYNASNALGLFVVSREELLMSFVEEWFDGSIQRQVIGESRFFLDKHAHASKSKREAVMSDLLANFKLYVPSKTEDEQQADIQIRVEGERLEDWLVVVQEVSKRLTEKVRQVQLKRFEEVLRAETNKRLFSMQDLERQIDLAQDEYKRLVLSKELAREYALQDVATKIENARSDYDLQMKNRLAFLIEQASIARQLGVARNTIEADTFGGGGGVVANVTTDRPFYLRGYEAIEKEVELIEGRVLTDAFVADLFGLEQELRALEQDRTLERFEETKETLEEVLKLKSEKSALEGDQTLVRARALFAETPIANQDQFIAVRLDILSSDVQKSIMNILAAVGVVLIGMIFCFAHVLLRAELTQLIKKFGRHST